MAEQGRATQGRALVTMFNVAPWGGLHENVLYSSTGLQSRGWEITVACRPGPLVDLLQAAGVAVHLVDWDDWRRSVPELTAVSWDVVHTHPFASRELGLLVSKETGARLVSTFHGYYQDALASWATRADSLIAVSRAHARMLENTENVDPSKVQVVPNALPSETFELRPLPLEEKIDVFGPTVLVASRLDPDKRALVGSTIELIEAITPIVPDWTVKVLGQGKSEREIRELLLGRRSGRIRVEFLGQVAHGDVKHHLHRSIFAVASGRGASQSLAVGTPVVAFGSQGHYGMQVGRNLQLGIWGNFGGYPLDDKQVTSVAQDARDLLTQPSRYESAQLIGRAVVRRLFRQEDADDVLEAAYLV